MPPGYNLSIVPPSIPVVPLEPLDGRSHARKLSKQHSRFFALKSTFQIRAASTLGTILGTDNLSSFLNCAKALVAVFHTLYASFTLYSARGDQIQRYGYAAFGLTVSSYLIMSIVNLVSTILTPDYSTVYLVKSEVMEEALHSGGDGYFEGCVGAIQKSSSSNVSLLCKFEFEKEYRCSLGYRDSSNESHWSPTSVEVALDDHR